MTKLTYMSIMSLDGYIGDGHYNWAKPAEGSKEFITEIIRPFRTYLYGRKNYETMSFWDTAEVEKMGKDDQDFARVWNEADKIIFSRTLDSVSSKNARIEREFVPEKIREMKSRQTKEMCIGGPTLAAQALRAKLVDEVILFVTPVTIGNSLPVIPVLPKEIPIELELLDHKSFGKNWIYLRYAVQN